MEQDHITWATITTCKQRKYHLDIGFYIFVHEFTNYFVIMLHVARTAGCYIQVAYESMCSSKALVIEERAAFAICID